MTTLSIEGIDEHMTTQLEATARQFNISVNEFVKRLIHQALNIHLLKKPPSIDSLFGIVKSSTDGVHFQNLIGNN
jgi:hypothetical protein